ncbi:MAG: GntR family transcriptional regulator [Myxococcales bacterium]|nr:GntR family transcriptional regulator [Myxococcales bacterium]
MSAPLEDQSPKSPGPSIYEALLGRILSDELPAGAKLPPERELAQALGTNRNTLREALRRLEQGGLVTARQGSGVLVNDFRRLGTMSLLGPFLEHGRSPVEKARVLLDLLAPRAEVLEVLVRVAAGRARAEDLWRMDEAIVAARKAEHGRDPGAYAAAQQAFLDALVEASHNLPLRWVANPLLAAVGDLISRRAEILLFEPSFADYAAGVRAALAGRQPEEGVRITRAFHAGVDAQLRGLLEPYAGALEEAEAEAEAEAGAAGPPGGAMRARAGQITSAGGAGAARENADG